MTNHDPSLGTLATGKGTRFAPSLLEQHQLPDHIYRLVLSNTEDLHVSLDQMSTRIHQLEDALAIAHRRYDADSTHPLLSDEFLSVRMGSRVESQAESTTNGGPESDLVQSLGTLTIDAGGKAKYYGATGTNGKWARYSLSPLPLTLILSRNPFIGE